MVSMTKRTALLPSAGTVPSMRRADLDAGEVVLADVEDHPDVGQVHQRQDREARAGQFARVQHDLVDMGRTRRLQHQFQRRRIDLGHTARSLQRGRTRGALFLRARACQRRCRTGPWRPARCRARPCSWSAPRHCAAATPGLPCTARSGAGRSCRPARRRRWPCPTSPWRRGCLRRAHPRRPGRAAHRPRPAPRRPGPAWRALRGCRA